MSGQIKIKQVLNKAYRKLRPTRAEIDLVKQELKKMLNEVNPKESEEHNKNLVRDYLKNTGFNNYYINTKERTDLVIHCGKKSDSNVGVIVETKGPNNKIEMITSEDINKKAMQQLLLYFLRERVTNKNYYIKNLIATNLYEWFIFDSKEFNRFTENKKLVNDFINFEEKRLSSEKTELFYKEIASPAIEKAKDTIKFVYFDIRDYNKYLNKQSDNEDKNLIELQKILSPVHLLNLSFANDSNTLNKEFYNELLHIIGLEEYREKSKKLISRKLKKNRDEDSLIEATIRQIVYSDKLSQVKKVEQFGDNKEHQLYNIALELVIIWIDRILFLKLLESQIVSYHNSKDYLFLKKEKVKEYDDLNTLFFQVLAVEEKERRKSIKDKFPHVPFLNSSLFEQTELEKETIFISNLSDDTHMPLYKRTVLKNCNGKINTLEYLLKFLDSFDFSSEPKESIAEEHKTLINASVLGLIFEKINGYKDGSYFTPGFITMYMCRDTIRRSIVQKFREQTNFEGQDLGELKNFIGGTYKKAELKKYNEIINSLKICDPAVGSGHFLVSSLNEIIAIKSELEILVDEEGVKLQDYLIDVENDELTILDNKGDFFNYDPNDKHTMRLQKTLFHEKERIIENCLFGVDINPNSVNICRLRLWIELLKNAYYKDNGQLETLPNIDINIKCGNSLIGRYPLDADLKEVLRESKFSIDTYRVAVNCYRNAENKEQKHEMEQLIEKIKGTFTEWIDEKHPKRKKLSKLRGKMIDLVDQRRLFQTESKKNIKKKIEKLTKEIEKAEAEVEELKTGVIYRNAFEWRFEFPEVLDIKTGDFTGFDIVIGNPPYGVSIRNKYREQILTIFDKVPDYEIYYFFVELSYELLKKGGVKSLIIPNTVLFNVFASNYRLKLLERWKINEILDCTNFILFENATVRNIITNFSKDKGRSIGYRNIINVSSFQELITKQKLTATQEVFIQNNQNWGLLFRLPKPIIDLITKIKKGKKPINHYFPEISQGLIAYDKYRGQSKEIIESRKYHYDTKVKSGLKPWLWGEDVKRYKVKWNNKEYIDYCDGIANPREPKYFFGKRILVREITDPKIYAAYTEEELYNDPAIIIILSGEHIDIISLLAILNSKLATFYHFNSSPKASKGAFPKILVEDIKKFPLVELNDKTTQLYDSLKNLAKKILAIIKDDVYLHSKSKKAEIQKIENQIDKLVYALYGLTPEEIDIVEGTNE